mgnify:CR=1 FL=1
MDRAFSPLAFKHTGTWGCAPGWYGMGLWPARKNKAHWAVIALGGRKNKAQAGDMGIAADCRSAAQRFWNEERRTIVLLTVAKLLEGHFAHKLA